jgi:hypothetical protein
MRIAQFILPKAGISHIGRSETQQSYSNTSVMEMSGAEQFTASIVHLHHISVFRTALHACHGSAEDPG